MGRRSVSICESCGDTFGEFICEHCSYGGLSTKCKECHHEVQHKIIQFDTGFPLCGNPTPYKEEDAKEFPATPWNKLSFRRAK